MRDDHTVFDINLVEAKRMKDFADRTKKQYSNQNAIFKNEIEKELNFQKEKILQILMQILNDVETAREMVEKLFSKIRESIDNAITDGVISQMLMGIVKIILIIVAAASTAAVAEGGSAWFPVIGWIAAGGAMCISEKKFRDNLQESIDQVDSLCSRTVTQKNEAVNSLSKYYDNFVSSCENIKPEFSKSPQKFLDYQNLIWFDKNIQSSANIAYQNKLKQEICKKLNFYFICDVVTLKEQLKKLEGKTFFISSGSAFSEIADLLSSYDLYVKHIILFCMNISKYREIYKNVVCFTSFQEVIEYTNKQIESQQEISEINEGLILLDKFKDYYSAVLMLLTDEYSYKSFSEIPLNDSNYESIKTFAISNNLYNISVAIDKFRSIIKNNQGDDNAVAEELLKEYTAAGPFFRCINTALRKIDFKVIQRCEIWIKALLLAFKKKKKFYQNFQKEPLYRGMKISQKIRKEYVAQFKKNDAIFFPAFTSTTAKKDVTKTFGDGILLEIHIDSKSALPMPFLDIKQIGSYFPNEQEYLFQPFSMFMVKDIIKEGENQFRIVLDNIN